MAEVYLNCIASALGSLVERNDAQTMGACGVEVARVAQKTGIRSRPIVGPGEFTSDLACRATEALLEQRRLLASDIDTLIVCTQTPDHLIPGVSSRVHGKLNMSTSCYAVDINQGCSGFVYGAQMAASMLRANSAKKVVLVNADTYSRLTRPSDLTTRLIFGDAATATLLSDQPKGLKILYSRCYSDGRGYDDFIAHNSALRPSPDKQRGIYMDGAGILSFALRVVPDAIANALAETNLKMDQIRTVAFHQANAFVIGKLAYKLQLRQDQVPQNGSELGNTVSASIPLLLREQMPVLRSKDLVMAIGFGVGLSWGTLLLEAV